MDQMNEPAHVVIITGLSGAGRSQAANVLEDIGYFVVDNLPTVLIDDLVNAIGSVEGSRTHIAVVVDTRAGMDAESLDLALIGLHRDGLRTTVLFLTADDRVLARRFEESRRPHPVDAASLDEAIALERAAFEDVRAGSDVIIDTSELNVHELRDTLRAAFTDTVAEPTMRIDVTSFGFKRGVPTVVDLLFDVRFLPNPHWVPDLRGRTGLDDPVREYVFSYPEATEFLDRVTSLLAFLVPHYEAEGKSYLMIGVGCTGGRHRSVALAEAIAQRLTDGGIPTDVRHRDVER
ncbi:RNase adapter protein RapZ [hydrothermal vent metagenome]|uniref:RNase adapter protein RapZ n=1 Tax=hydrothermal vent metagenome TaxID=652676 RepID=A0A3B0SRK1_9ZZZZ